jgi:hypothetical protein
MSDELIPIGIKGVVPASGTCMIFLGNDDKTFVIFIDHLIGQALTIYMSEQHRQRPLTHDLITAMMKAFGAELKRVIINDAKDKTFFARIILESENEIHEKMIVELDARPSDSLCLAVLHQAPLFVTAEVFDSVEDTTETLHKIQSSQESGSGREEEEEGDDDSGGFSFEDE